MKNLQTENTIKVTTRLSESASSAINHRVIVPYQLFCIYAYTELVIVTKQTYHNRVDCTDSAAGQHGDR